MQVCAIPPKPTPQESWPPDCDHWRLSNTQRPKPPIVSKTQMPAGPKIQQTRSASQVAIQTSWEDKTRASMSDSLDETHFDEESHVEVGGGFELETVPLLEHDGKRPRRSIGSSLRKRSMKVRQRAQQLFRSQSSPTNSESEVSGASSKESTKAQTNKEKAAETVDGRGSLNGVAYRAVVGLLWCLPVPFEIMPLGIPIRVI
ncbi:hypothetical protein LZ30DRAFT_585356 [Colletotrichum cereale]|nr:hypothetical protein LZ30DRAFT_585356 [Colletotrichum cereale]